MVTIEQVRAMNEKIDKLNAASAQAQAEVKVHTENVQRQCAEIQKEYGVDLWGDGNLAGVEARVTAWVSKVQAEVEAEYAKAAEVVAAIESGDTSKAIRLLGGEVAEVSEIEDVPMLTEDLEVSREAVGGITVEFTEDIDLELNTGGTVAQGGNATVKTVHEVKPESGTTPAIDLSDFVEDVEEDFNIPETKPVITQDMGNDIDFDSLLDGLEGLE